jgi:uncharacterized protein YprB with RNaseH-like and TPR domain
MPASDLRSRLQRLRVQKARRELPPSGPPAALKPRQPPAEGVALPGQELITSRGVFQFMAQAYPLDQTHGKWSLATWLERDPATAARLIRPAGSEAAGLRALTFIDIETTGLAGGAGTLAFLVGTGAYRGDEFVLNQYFLRDPGEEDAMLNQLVEDLAASAGWVTFNGRTFDLPILETRLTLNRQRGALGERPNLDLLPLARRLYQRRLPSCALGDLEKHVLELEREQDDVPGALIPQMYTDYLRTRDPGDMRRVIYHNAMDILSMAVLGAHLLEAFATPLEAPTAGSSAQATAIAAQPPGVLVRLGNWHDDNGRPEAAETAYRQALSGQLELEDRRLGLTRLAALLKRQGRREAAAGLWEQLASFSTDDPEPFVELAKYYEWHASSLNQAIAWTKRALRLVAGWPDDWRRAEIEGELKHRLERLKSKAGK